MHHIGELTAIHDAALADTSEHVRAARGQFFTHELVGRRLAEHVAKGAAIDDLDCVRAVDPFAGDGRLIGWLVEAWPNRKQLLELEVWETDEVALKAAAELVRAAIERSGQSASLIARHVDSFVEALDRSESFDIVVTNPPWEAIKPDRRFLQALPEPRRNAYVGALREVDETLAWAYPEAQPSKKFAGWGTNLSRVGTAVAQRLTRRGGEVGIVLPASFAADATHAKLRRSLRTAGSLIDVASYPAEAKLFANVDVHFISVQWRKDPDIGNAVRVTQFDRYRQAADPIDVAQPNKRDDEWRLPLHPSMLAGSAVGAVAKFPTLGSLLAKPGFWAGRELDETGLAQKLSTQGVPFLKGRNVHRFTYAEDRSALAPMELADTFPSTSHPRLVWRDVSRPSQARRVQAAVIPAGPLTGNSLGVLTVPDDNPTTLHWLLGIFSSAVFEAQLRAILSTGHVTLGSLRKMHLPPATGKHATRIAELAKKQIKAHSVSTQAELELAVAAAYGLTIDEVTELFSRYPWLPDGAVPGAGFIQQELSA